MVGECGVAVSGWGLFYGGGVDKPLVPMAQIFIGI